MGVGLEEGVEFLALAGRGQDLLGLLRLGSQGSWQVSALIDGTSHSLILLLLIIKIYGSGADVLGLLVC